MSFIKDHIHLTIKHKETNKQCFYVSVAWDSCKMGLSRSCFVCFKMHHRNLFVFELRKWQKTDCVVRPLHWPKQLATNSIISTSCYNWLLHHSWTEISNHKSQLFALWLWFFIDWATKETCKGISSKRVDRGHSTGSPF